MTTTQQSMAAPEPGQPEESLYDYLVSGYHGTCITEAGLDRVWPRDDETVPLAGAGKGLHLPPTCRADAATYEEAAGRENLVAFVFDGPRLPDMPDAPGTVPLGDSGIYLVGVMLLAFLSLKFHPKANYQPAKGN